MNAAKTMAQVFLQSKHVNSDIIRDLMALLDNELKPIEFPKL